MCRHRCSSVRRADVETSDGPVRFRILAGAAHSWATLLLESEPGALFVYQLPTGELELIDRAGADRQFAAGTYRPWLGATGWTTLAGLPVVGLASTSSPDATPRQGELSSEQSAP